jgi:hypothetical protein
MPGAAKTINSEPLVVVQPIVQLDSIEAMVVAMLFVLQLVQHMNLQSIYEC